MKSSRVIGILVSVGLIIGGLSGRLALRGTNSSTALVIVGIIFLAIDIIGAVKDSRQKEEEDTSSYDQSQRPQQFQDYTPPQKVERTDAEWHAYFADILRNHFPQYTVKEHVPVTELTGDVSDVFQLYERRPNQVYKDEWGRPYDFVLFHGDKAVTAVMLGEGHCHSTAVKYLISRMFAQKLNIPYQGFYTQFPNKEDYVVNRIREGLGQV